MPDTARQGISGLAGLSILVIIPLYFIYQSLAQAGLIAPVLKGFFTAGMLAAAIRSAYAASCD